MNFISTQELSGVLADRLLTAGTHKGDRIELIREDPKLGRVVMNDYFSAVLNR